MNLKQWIYDEFGLYDDEWTSLQFDNACTTLGLMIEGKLNDYDSHGKPKHRLVDILADKPAAGGGWQSLFGFLTAHG